MGGQGGEGGMIITPTPTPADDGCTVDTGRDGDVPGVLLLAGLLAVSRRRRR
jgi:MYXO-CTERM domain-containing protein